MKSILYSIIVLLLLHVILIFNALSCAENSSTNNSGDNTFGNEVAGPPVTRSEVIQTGDKYARLHWTMTEQNRTGVTCEGNFTSDYAVGSRIGMGYKWGGWDNIEDFTDKIEQGYGTGTGGYVSYLDYPFSCVVGISCTGFVSRAWHLDSKYTLNYPDRPDIVRKFNRITQPVSGVDFGNQVMENLKKGDAFINAGHIILFVYENRSGYPMIMDSSLEGVRFQQLSWNYLANNGYEAIRYNNIQDVANPLGTKANPIIFQTEDLPFRHEGNTRDVVSMEFDSYATAPEINEQGPENIFQLFLNRSETLIIQVTDIKNENIDNDIHLLNTLQADENNNALDCIDRADNIMTHTLEQGIYFIIVDSNNDQPGEYILAVDFAF
ncbi:hypothetical protein B6I21_03905 [candidate division KSB1 bacterium 4572_119]|nr:MAG: hypothetical protein B6I21_03905 [candidate division KSB1 bacterium 4572_119]